MNKDTIPTSLTHYTSLDVLWILLQAVATDNPFLTFHCSHIDMMNDPDESPFILSQFFTNSDLKQKLKEKWDKDFLPNHTPFVLSLSVSTNELKYSGLLPMWNMYADKGKGCLIKFDYKKLKHWTETISNTHLLKCKYVNSVERSAIVSKINDDKENFENLLYEMAATKYNCWEYEKEWRMLVTLSREKVKFKNTQRGIIEYTELKIPIEFVKEIMLGPLTISEISLTSLLHFKEKLQTILSDKVNFDIHKSNIKIR